MRKHTILFKNMKFLFHFNVVRDSHCNKCGTKVPGQPKLYVEGDNYKSAEYLIDNLDKVKLHIINKELKGSTII
jgi:hypothetical protein